MPRRLITLLLAIVCVVVLASCGGGEPSENDDLGPESPDYRLPSATISASAGALLG